MASQTNYDQIIHK